MVEGITAQEAALYDRQIRLWGMDAQTRMRSTHVLIIGMNGLANEVIKNLVLAGIGKLTILSNELAGEVGCQFFTRKEDTGFKLDHAYSRIQALNPTVQVTIDTSSWKDHPTDYFKNYDIILLCTGDQQDLIKINNICTMHGIKFLASRLDGFYGYIFSDLGMGFKYKRQGESESKSMDFVPWDKASRYVWESRELSGKSLKKFKRSVSSVYFLYSLLWECMEGRIDYNDLNEILSLKVRMMAKMGADERFVSTALIQDFFGMIGKEIAPSAAILGGVLAQEVLKIVAQNEVPIFNYFGFDAQEPSGIIMSLI